MVDRPRRGDRSTRTRLGIASALLLLLQTAACSSGANRVDAGPCVSGASCDTGEAGACAVGSAICLPNGARECEAVVFPDVEVCNGIDDSCVGTVDVGCPRSVETSTGDPQRPPSAIGSATGVMFERQCEPGQLLVGLSGRGGAAIDQVRARCQRVAIVENREAIPFQYSIVREEPTFLLAPDGGNGGGPFDYTCPENEVVIALLGTGSGGPMDGLSVRCGSLALAGSPGAYSVVISPGASGPTWGPNTTLAMGSTCPDGTVATGIYGSADAFVTQLGTLCRSLAIVEQEDATVPR